MLFYLFFSCIYSTRFVNLGKFSIFAPQPTCPVLLGCVASFSPARCTRPIASLRRITARRRSKRIPRPSSGARRRPSWAARTPWRRWQRCVCARAVIKNNIETLISLCRADLFCVLVPLLSVFVLKRNPRVLVLVLNAHGHLKLICRLMNPHTIYLFLIFTRLLASFIPSPHRVAPAVQDLTRRRAGRSRARRLLGAAIGRTRARRRQGRRC